MQLPDDRRGPAPRRSLGRTTSRPSPRPPGRFPRQVGHLSGDWRARPGSAGGVRESGGDQFTRSSPASRRSSRRPRASGCRRAHAPWPVRFGSRRALVHQPRRPSSSSWPRECPRRQVRLERVGAVHRRHRHRHHVSTSPRSRTPLPHHAVLHVAHEHALDEEVIGGTTIRRVLDTDAVPPSRVDWTQVAASTVPSAPGPN